MMGRNHLIAGSALAAAGMSLLHRATQLPRQDWTWTQVPGSLVSVVATGAGAVWDWMMPHGMVWWWVLVGAGLFWIGTYLPDVDSKSSKLGRHLPIHRMGPHHGFTHTDWMLGLLLLAAVPAPTRILVFVWLGAAIHCELDAFSMAGRVRFYPVQPHKVIALPRGGGDCVVLKRPRRFVYRVGRPSETVALWIALGVSAAGLALAWLP